MNDNLNWNTCAGCGCDFADNDAVNQLIEGIFHLKCAAVFVGMPFNAWLDRVERSDSIDIYRIANDRILGADTIE